MEVLEVTQRTRLIILGAFIGGLSYIFGGCELSILFDSDAVIIGWWGFLAVGSLTVPAWLKWPRGQEK